MKIEVSHHQFRVLVVTIFTFGVVLMAFGLPAVLYFFGVKKVFADLSSVVICGMCYALVRRWPTFVEFSLPEAVRVGLRRLGCQVVYANSDE